MTGKDPSMNVLTLAPLNTPIGSQSQKRKRSSSVEMCTWAGVIPVKMSSSNIKSLSTKMGDSSTPPLLRLVLGSVKSGKLTLLQVSTKSEVA